MSIDALLAAQAYARPPEEAASGAAAGGADFAAMVMEAVEDVGETLRSAETVTQQAASGEASMVDVVTSVTSAEATLETVVAVRDQVIRAYQEILRMPI